MSAAPSWEPVGPESAAERTDPLLPVISADVAPPPAVPTLDDRRLAGLLAELDAEDLLPEEPAAEPSPAARTAESPAASLPAPAAPLPAQSSPAPAAPLPAVLDPVVESPARTRPAGRYVRREYQPPPIPADAMSLTGLSRRTGGRVGTVLFTAFFLGIFLLILVEVVVSLLQASS